MTSDLLTFRDHCRAMSTAQHKPECLIECQNWNGTRSFFLPGPSKADRKTPCTGCVTDSDRAMWTDIADEIDAHLTREAEKTPTPEPEEAGLFG